jgi:hypothetical protein
LSFFEIAFGRKLIIEDLLAIEIGTVLQLLLPKHDKFIDKGRKYNNLYTAVQSMQATNVAHLHFCDIDFYHVRCTVSSNPSYTDIRNSLLKNSDVVRMYNQSNGINVTLAGIPAPVPVKWSDIMVGENNKIVPIMVWADVGYHHDYFSLLKRKGVGPAWEDSHIMMLLCSSLITTEYSNHQQSEMVIKMHLV